MDDGYFVWFDETKSDDQAKIIRQAASRFREKHQQAPDICLVNEDRLNGLSEIDGMCE